MKLGKVKRVKWKFPEWMVQFMPFMTDPQRTEEFMNCDGVNCNVIVNGPRALLCTSAQAEVGLLERLHKNKLI